jgi:alkanesulfonate monooxygenase SsuD/methylene tetrahydromethanopterin reductase-like flavin-dependent oxidoreductase (luciferase family)
MKKRMHLAFDLSYIHVDGRWRMPGAWPGVTYPDVTMYEEIARIAERGRLDMLFSGDGTGVPSTWQGSRDAAVRWGISWPRQDLAPLAVAMARVTKHLGFGVTYSTTFMHPYYLARLFNSLDHVTGGRFATGYERTVAGTAAQVADHMEAVFEATGSRGGFMLGHVVSMPGDLAAIVELLVPELQRRGRFRTEYKGTTLRENLFDDAE